MRRFHLLLIPLVALALEAGCSGKPKRDDADAADGADAGDLPEGAEVPLDGEDVPPDEASEDVGEETEAPAPPAHVLRYLGRYEHQSDGPDHLMASALLDAGPLLVASATGVAAVDASAIRSGTVTSHMGKYMTDTGAASNLDGAPTGSNYFPMFVHVAALGTTAYAAARYEGLTILSVTGSGSSWTISEVRRHIRAREFTERAQVVGDLLYLAHHADGVEVMDVGTDPTNPTSIDTLADPLVDAWGIWADEDGKVWVADGAGGVKYLRFLSGTLSHVTGDTVTTAPGTALDVAVTGTWVVAAMAGQGIGVYEEWTAAHRNSYELPGVCVDVETMSEGVVAVACRDWVHVIEIDSLGLIDILASARLHRRLDGTSVSTHIGSHVTVDGNVLYVSGWDHLDVFELVDTDPDAAPDIQVSGQRAHFGDAAGTAYFHVWNAGQGTLEISGVECTEPSLSCPIDDTTIPPGGRTTLRIVSDGTGANIQTLVNINSNDPDEPTVPILTFVALSGALDPGETAPGFTGTATTRDYSSDTFSDATLTLSDYTSAGEVVHFAIFGSW